MADGRFRGEHHGIGAVEHGIGHIRRFRPGRPQMLRHGLEHLRRGDHQPSLAIRRRNDSLLQHRHGFRAELNAQISARHHNPVGVNENGLQVRDGLLPLDLGDHRHVAAAFGNQFLGGHDVLRSTDKG